MVVSESERKFIPLVASQLAPSLDDLNTEFVQELSETDGKNTLEDLILMLKNCPVNRVAIELKALRTAIALGEYCHGDSKTFSTPSGDKTIQEWVRGNFDSMKGSLTDVVGKIIRQAYALGLCCAEIVWGKHTTGFRTEWRLKRINILSPLRYRFAGSRGNIDRIIYTSSFNAPFAIPYSKLIHVYSPRIDEPDDPRGDPQAARAYPIYQARKILLKQWTVAGQRQATGLLVIKASNEETTTILDKNGNPLKNPDGSNKTQPALFAALQSAKEIENGSVYGTDKRNDVLSIPGNAGEGFFNTALTHYEKLIFYCYGVPSTIFSDTASGIGNSGINAGHRLILDNQIEGIVQSLRDELLEKVVRPLLRANFGTQFENNLGEFKSEKFLDPAMAATRVNNLTIALTNQLIDPNDLEATNRLREDLGLSPLSKQDFDQQQLAKLLAQQEQQVQMEEQQNTG